MAQQKSSQSGSDSGFASMDEDKQRDIASKGGSSVPDEKRSFSRDHELAAEAGRKGGKVSHGGSGEAEGSSASHSSGKTADDRERAAEAGRKGGKATHGGSDDEDDHRGGNFADNREKASEAGRKGGKASQG